MSERIKPTISGSAETMLQSFYARAQYSKSKHNKFYDAKAVELVDKIDYDFSTAARDSTMGKGVIARTVVFDELVKNFIEKNPDCTVVNIACGLDTRFYRMDNGKITWYNPEKSPSINSPFFKAVIPFLLYLLSKTELSKNKFVLPLLASFIR